MHQEGAESMTLFRDVLGDLRHRILPPREGCLAK